MAYIFTATEYVTKLINIATNYNTHYRGTNGSTAGKYNIGAWDGTNFCFDCSGLVKSVLWGWSGNKNATYGGAVYCSNNVPDINDDASWGFGKYATNTDVLNAPAGALLWKQGHVGISAGGGYAVECTPAFAGGVQKTAISGRGWSKWGYLPWINYSVSLNHKVGETITISGIYTNSASTKKLTPKYKTVTITKVVGTANNPYMISYNGTIVGWTNDNCVVEATTTTTSNTPLTDKFLEGLAKYGDGSQHYYMDSDGTGIGCSNYLVLGLKYAGILKSDDVEPWAIKSRKGCLTDTTRFKQHSASETPKDGWIQWYDGAHVSIYDSKDGKYPNGRWEAAPESTHGICDNGKTGVGYWSNHNYECAGKSLTCYYEIIESGEEPTYKTLTPLVRTQEAVEVIKGTYGTNPGRKNTLTAKYGETEYQKIQDIVTQAYK